MRPGKQIPARLPLLIIFLQGMMFLSCNEEAIDWDLKPVVPDLIVVEGVLTNERKSHEIKIHRPVASPSDEPEPVSGAAVAIFNGSIATLLTETSPGTYVTSPNYRAVINRLYRLVIYLNGREYSASSYLVPVRPMDEADYRASSDNPNWYRFNLRESRDASMMEISLDWSHLPGFRKLPPDSCRARIVYYTVHSVDVNKMFRPDREEVFFPLGTRVVRRKYSLNPYHEDFVRTLMAETEWRGGLFDVQPGNVQTNLSEGALGYFSVSQVLSDSLLITPR